MSIPNSYFNYISIGICLIFIALVIFGYIKGFLYELVSVFFTAIAVIFSWFVAPILANLYPIINLETLYPEYSLFMNFVNLDAILNSFAYFLIVFLVLKVFYFVFALLLKGMNKIPVLGKVNKILGAIVGCFNGLLICLVLSMLLTLPIFKNGNEVRNGTVLKYTNKLNSDVLSFIAKNVDLENIKNQFENFDVDNAREELQNWLDSSNE